MTAQSDRRSRDREVVVPASRRGAPRAYSPGTAFGALIFTSGLTAADPLSGEVPAGIEAQTRRCFEKLDDILRAGGSSLDRVMRVTVYLTDIGAQQAPMTAVWREVFPSAPPARPTVQVAALSGPDIAKYAQHPVDGAAFGSSFVLSCLLVC